MIQWKPIETAPKDGTRFEARGEGLLPILAYYGGGEDKAFREWNRCHQLTQEFTEWREERTT